MFTYKIKNKTVSLYLLGQEEPFVSQPNYPSGEGWTVEEATAWAELFVNARNNPDADYLPGNGKAKPVIHRSELPVFEDPELDPPVLVEEEAPEEEAPAEVPKTAKKK
jgi:hypothetical protein